MPQFVFTGGGIFPGAPAVVAPDVPCVNTGALAPGDSCIVGVTYIAGAPSAPTDLSDLEISYNDGLVVVATDPVKPLSAVSVAPALITVTPAFKTDFGPITVAGEDTHIFVLENTGGFDATSLAAAFGDTTHFNFSGGGVYPGTPVTIASEPACGTDLTPASKCRIEVSFAPLGVAPSLTTTLDINYLNGAGAATPIIVNLEGESLGPPNLDIRERLPVDTFDMGETTQGTSITRTYEVENLGGTTAVISSIIPFSSPEFSLQNGSFTSAAPAGYCGTSVAPSEVCLIDVRFLAGVPGLDITSDLSVDYDNGAGGTSNETETLIADSLAPALLTLVSTDDPFNYGDVAAEGALTEVFTVDNICLLYTSPSPRDATLSRMPSSA